MNMILGIDEVGRGPWAGPLVVGAVVLPELTIIDGLADSKKLNAKKREALDVIIRQKSLGFGLGGVFPDELDSIGLSSALRIATQRAVESVKTPYHQIIIDGTINLLEGTSKGDYVTVMPKADALIPAVSAAAIIAKVARDAYMSEQDLLYPNYGFASHVGYGTAKHRQALSEYGVTPLHRRSFAPIAKILGESPAALVTNPVVLAKTTTELGGSAESLVSDWLIERGYKIIDRNWKTKYCEIDIVAKKKGILYFIEVKYRSSNGQGGGMAAVTSKKVQQMQFGTELYLAKIKSTASARLAVASVDLSRQVTFTVLE